MFSRLLRLAISWLTGANSASTRWEKKDNVTQLPLQTVEIPRCLSIPNQAVIHRTTSRPQYRTATVHGQAIDRLQVITRPTMMPFNPWSSLPFPHPPIPVLSPQIILHLRSMVLTARTPLTEPIRVSRSLILHSTTTVDTVTRIKAFHVGLSLSFRDSEI